MAIRQSVILWDVFICTYQNPIAGHSYQWISAHNCKSTPVYNFINGRLADKPKPNIDLSAEKTTAMLYTLADKFLDRAELDEIKEVMRMTRLGQMLMDEGMEKGIELKETDSIKKLMKNMNLTIDQAMNALEVPADKREKYCKTITPNN